MILRTLTPATLAALFAGCAAMLVTLHLLRVKRRQHSVPTLLFWKSATQAQRARRLGGRLRHPRTLAFLLLLAALLLGAIADPDSTEGASARGLVLDAGVTSASSLPWLVERARAHGAEDAETALLIAKGGSVVVFPPGSSAAQRREALEALTNNAEPARGLDDLEPLVRRAAALVRGATQPEVVVLSARAVQPSGITVLQEAPQRVAPVFPAAAEHPLMPVTLETDPDLGPAVQALRSVSITGVGAGPVRMAAAQRGQQLSEHALSATSLSGVRTVLHDAVLPRAPWTHGIEAPAGARVLLRAGSVPLVAFSSTQTPTLWMAADLLDADARLAEDPAFMALLFDWVRHAAGPVPLGPALVASAQALSVDPEMVAAESGDIAAYGTDAWLGVSPAEAGVRHWTLAGPAAIAARWPAQELLAAQESAPLRIDTWAWWQVLGIVAIALLCLDGLLHARGRIP